MTSYNDVIVTHIMVSDRFFLQKKSTWQYLLDQAHMLVKGICCSVPGQTRTYYEGDIELAV